MSSMTHDGRPGSGDAPLLVLRILWGALFASQFLYVFVVQMVVIPASDSQEQLDATVEQAGATGSAVAESAGALPWTVFAGLAAVTIMLAYALPKLLAASAAKSPHQGGHSPYGQEPLPAIVRRATVPFLLRLALLEAVAAYGLVASMLNHDPKLIFGFVAVSALAMIHNFPTEERIRGLLSR